MVIFRGANVRDLFVLREIDDLIGRVKSGAQVLSRRLSSSPRFDTPWAEFGHKRSCARIPESSRSAALSDP